jgi:hypothetical protein
LSISWPMFPNTNVLMPIFLIRHGL